MFLTLSLIIGEFTLLLKFKYTVCSAEPKFTIFRVGEREKTNNALIISSNLKLIFIKKCLRFYFYMYRRLILHVKKHNQKHNIYE